MGLLSKLLLPCYNFIRGWNFVSTWCFMLVWWNFCGLVVVELCGGSVMELCGCYCVWNQWNICVCTSVNCVWLLPSDVKPGDDGWADIYIYICVYSALVPCDERFVCRHWIWMPASSWMPWLIVTPYSCLKTWPTTIPNKTKHQCHIIYINITWHERDVTKSHPNLTPNPQFVTTVAKCDALTNYYVTVSTVIKGNNLWRHLVTVTKGQTICDGFLWNHHAVHYVMVVIWRPAWRVIFIISCFIWQFFDLTWQMVFVIQAQIFCSASPYGWVTRFPM